MGCTIRTASNLLGFTRSLEREPFLAIFQAYFDESGKHHNESAVTFSGVCLSGESLPAFDSAWDALLRQHGLECLHMAEVRNPNKPVGSKIPGNQTYPERIESLKPFADCIVKHMELGLVQAWDVKGFEAMDKNALKNLGNPKDSYHLAFTRAMLELAEYVRSDDHLSLICDDDETTAYDCYQHYRAVRRVNDDVHKKVVSLSFANDRLFPALQAADMVAYLSRLEAKYRFFGEDYEYRPLQEYLTKDRPSGQIAWRSIFVDYSQAQKLSASLQTVQKMDRVESR
jgi:hypothetical protein